MLIAEHRTLNFAFRHGGLYLISHLASRVLYFPYLYPLDILKREVKLSRLNHGCTPGSIKSLHQKRGTTQQPRSDEYR